MAYAAGGTNDGLEPEVHLVAPGAHRIPLPLPFDGLDEVNCYVLEGPTGLVLVDPGWAMPQTEAAMRYALRELGHSLGDIAVCVATHHHWDHSPRHTVGVRRSAASCAWAARSGTASPRSIRPADFPSMSRYSPNAAPMNWLRDSPRAPPQSSRMQGLTDCRTGGCATANQSKSIGGLSKSSRPPDTPEGTSSCTTPTPVCCSPVTTSCRASLPLWALNGRPSHSRCGPSSPHLKPCSHCRTPCCCPPMVPYCPAVTLAPGN